MTKCKKSMFYFVKWQCVILFNSQGRSKTKNSGWYAPLPFLWVLRRRLQLPTMTFNNNEIKRTNLLKVLGVIIDENLAWKNHIEVKEKKISKNIGVFYRNSHLLDFKRLLQIYFSSIHIYINHVNIAWVSTLILVL